MLVNYDRRTLAGVTAAVVTTAAFAKMFLPFYLIGSTAIFAATALLGAALIATDWRPLYDMADKVTGTVLLLGLLYAWVVINFLLLSRPTVPTTHLLGILIFHALFMIFGFAAARALNVFLMTLLGGAAIYVIVIVHYTIRFGDLQAGGYLHDIFGIGEPAVSVTFHQNMGILFGLAALAALGLTTNRITRILAIGALPIVLLFMFHISARAGLVGLVCSLVFWIGANLWLRSRRLTLLAVFAAAVAVALASNAFYQRALQDKDVDAVAPDAISRTIREIQDPRPLFRLQIWQRTWHQIATEPDRLPFGRGIGMFPVNEGFGAPDWLLRKTEGSKYYPHNVHLEMLYEAGIAGLLLFGLVTLFPLASSLTRWHLFSLAEKSVASMYVFYLVGSALSGAFAFQFLYWFFFALAVGTIAMKRMEGAAAAGRPSDSRADADGMARLSSGTASVTNSPV